MSYAEADYDLRNKFGQRLRRCRLGIGMTQSDLAELTCLDRSWISHFETGSRLPSLENYKELVLALDLTGDEAMDLIGVRKGQR